MTTAFINVRDPRLNRPTSVPDIGLWARHAVVRFDITDPVVDLAHTAGIGVARGLHGGHFPYEVIVSPVRLASFTKGSVAHDVVCHARKVHELDTDDVDQRRRLLDMCDQLLVMPDIDLPMIHLLQRDKAFGMGTVDTYDYEDLAATPVACSTISLGAWGSTL